MVALRLQEWERYEQELEEAQRNLLVFEDHATGMQDLLAERAERLKGTIERADAAIGNDNYSRKAEKDLRKPLESPLTLRSSNAPFHITPMNSPLPYPGGRARQR